MLRKDVVEELLNQIQSQYNTEIKSGLLSEEVTFKEFLKYQIITSLSAALILKLDEHTLNVSYLYLMYFTTKFNVDDIFKFLKTRSHRYEPSEKTYRELTTMLISSITEDRFSATTLMKFLYSGSH